MSGGRGYEGGRTRMVSYERRWAFQLDFADNTILTPRSYLFL